MIKILENIQKQNFKQEKVMSKPRKGKSPLSKLNDMKHDGLHIDYNKFNELAKGVLKDANVLRQKSIHTSNKIERNSGVNRSMAGGIPYSQNSSQLNDPISIPPMSARLSSQGNSQVVRKRFQETPQWFQGRSPLSVPKYRPVGWQA